MLPRRKRRGLRAAHAMSVRKTYKEKLRPTPAQEGTLDEVLWRCRTLYNMALE